MAHVTRPVIDGRYRMDDLVRAGSTGESWLGVHLNTGQRVGLKRLFPAAHSEVESSNLARFRRSASLLCRVRSDYVVRAFDLVLDDEHGLVLVSEFLDGPTLEDVLAQRVLSVEEALDVGIDVLRGLCDMHAESIVHRNVKPAVIVMHRRPDGSTRAILNDLGLCRLIWTERPSSEEPTGVTPTDAAIGTLLYMAPEQIVCARDVTAAVDAYAVGWLLYRAVAGRHPLSAPSDGKLARLKLSEDPPPLRTGRSDPLARGFEEIVTKAIRITLHERFSSAASLLAELVRLRTFGATSIGSTSLLPGAPRDATGPLAYTRSSSPPPLQLAGPRLRSHVTWIVPALAAAAAVGGFAYSLARLSAERRADVSAAASTNVAPTVLAPVETAPPAPSAVAPAAAAPTSAAATSPAASAPSGAVYRCARGSLSVDGPSKLALLAAMKPHGRTTVAPILVEAFGDEPGPAGLVLAERRARIARLLMTHAGVASARVIARGRDLADEPGSAGVVRVRLPLVIAADTLFGWSPGRRIEGVRIATCVCSPPSWTPSRSTPAAGAEASGCTPAGPSACSPGSIVVPSTSRSSLIDACRSPWRAARARLRWPARSAAGAWSESSRRTARCSSIAARSTARGSTVGS